jgi:hypothetical protein
MKLPHNTIVKAPFLLPMLYKVREMAEDLHMPERTLRDWLERGAPHERDANRQIWINGEKFAAWVAANRKKRKKAKLKDDQAYCFRCKKIEKLVNPQIVPIKGQLIHIKGKCPVCGCTINRGGRIGQSEELFVSERAPDILGRS